MNKLCLLTNMTSTETASWVQAIGSILVLIIMIGIAVFQQRQVLKIAEWQQLQVLKMDRDAKINRAIHAWFLAAFFGRTLIDTLTKMLDGATVQTATMIKSRRFILSDILRWGRDIELQALNPEGVSGLIDLRAVALEVENLFANGMPTWGHLESNLRDLRNTAHKRNQEMLAARPAYVNSDDRNANHPSA